MTDPQTPPGQDIEVEAPDGNIIAFPSSMTSDDISAAMRKLYPPTNKAIPEPPPFLKAPSAPMASPSTSVAGSSPVGSGAGQTAPAFVPPELPPDLIGASRITQEPDMASVAVDQTNTLMTPGEQEFRKEFAPMDLAAVKEFKEKKIPQKMQLIQQQQAGLEADKKALEEARVQLESSLAQAQQQMAENPAIAPQLQAQYQADVDRYNQMVASANKQAESMKDLARSVEADYQKADLQEYNLKSQQGGFFGASHNKIVEGVLSMASVVPDFGIDMITGLTPESMLPSIGGAAGKSRDQLAKEWKRDIIPAFKEAGMDLWRSGTTEEYEAEMNKGILGRSWLGLMQSAPAMATPMMSGIFLQVYDGAKEEMRGEEWGGVPEGEKNAMAALLALPATALERMGFSNLAANNPFVKQVLARSLASLPKNATKEQIEAVINAETTDAVMNYGIRAAGATIAEAETGGAQYITDVAMKDMFNRFLGEDGKFELPKSWGEYAQSTVMSMAEEGIGGLIMGQLPALAAARRAKKNVGEVTTDTQFELLEETLKNPEYLPMMQEQLKRQVESAKISEAQAAETIASWKEAQQIVSKIPEDLQTEKRREAFDLLTQKAKLSKMDKALVGDKVAAIDAKLMKLAGVEPETSKEGDPKPAPTATQADIDAATGVTEVVEPVVKTGEDLQLAEAPMIATGNAFGNPPSGIRFFHGTTKESADSIRSSGFTGTAGKRTRSAGIDTDGVFLYPNDPDAAMEFAKNHDGDTEVIEARVDGRIYNSDDGIKKAPNGRYLDELVDEAYGWENDLQITEIAKDKSIIDQLRRDGYVAVTAPELGIPVTFVFDLSAVSANSKPDSSQRTGAQQLTTPQQATGGRPLSSQSLQDTFGYTKEVADATEAIADAMGLDKSKIKVVKGGEVGEGALMQDEIGGWYSRLDQMVSSKGSTMPATQWKAWIEARAKEGSMSMDEARWTGLSDWLSSKGNEKITPQQVREFMNKNRLNVEVKELGKSPRGGVGVYQDSGKWVASYGDGTRELFDTLQEAQVAARSENAKNKTKFGQWQMPGASNYREVTISLPDAITTDKGIVDYTVPAPHQYGSRSLDVNRLLHLRLNDRTGPNGEKVLFIEELQSDWGQQGKKDGFADPDRRKLITDKLAREEELTEAEEATRLAMLRGDMSIPSAPFVTSTEAWTELGLKQAIRMAVDGGYGRVAWTTGEQQAYRYDLSKQVDRIDVEKVDDVDGLYFVDIKMPDGSEQNLEVENGVVRDGEFKGKGLDEVVGKEVADRILSGGSQTLSGNGLKVGGSGMKGFYDKILPSIAKKMSKRMGGDGVVSDIEMLVAKPGDNTDRIPASARWSSGNLYMDQQSIAITPEMKAKVSSGVPLMQDAKGAVEFAEGGDAIIRALQNPDPSTGIHELSHVARRFLLDRNVPQENRLGITDAHIETAEQWSGAKDGNWTREAEEKFARGFERYLRDGNAPNEALKDVFAKFKQWLTDIYRNLFNSPVKEMVSPEMRKVFDALVTRGPQTKAPRTADPTVATKANDAATGPAAPLPVEPAKPEPKATKPQTAGDRLRAKKIDVSKLGDIAFSLPLPVPVKTIAEAVNAAIEVAALALDAGDSISDAISRARESFRNTDWYKNLDTSGKQKANSVFRKHVEAPIADTGSKGEGGAEGVKKTFAGRRVYEGAFRDEVREEVRKLGLFRGVESRAEAREKAKKLIESVGIDAAVDAVRNKDMEGGAAAFVWDEALRQLDAQILESTDPTTHQELVAKQAQMVQEIGDMQLAAGRFNSAWGDILKNSDLGYHSEKKAKEWEDKFGERPSKEIMDEWRKRDEELAELKKKLDAAEKRAEEAEARATIEAIAEAVTRDNERTKSGRYSGRAKRMADEFRKLKTKPIVILDADGKPINITKLGSALPFDWNELIEVGAKAIEKTGQLADAVTAMAEKLNKQKWFASLDSRNKMAVMSQLEDAVKGASEGFGNERIKVPVAMIRNAVAAGIRDIDMLVNVIKEQIKDQYPDASDREIRDAITGYGKVVNMSKDEISVAIRRMKDIGRVISALEDVEKKIRPMRSGLQRDKLDADQRALHNKLRDAMKDLPVDQAENDRALKTALEAAKTRARNRIEDLQREIDTKERAERKQSGIIPDSELAALIKERDMLKEEHDRVFGPRVVTEEMRVKSALDSIRRSIEEYERRIATNELDTKKQAPALETPELKIARENLGKLRDDYKKLQDEAGVIDRRRTEAAKRATKSRIAELERRIADQDFKKKDVRKTIADDELTALRAEKERIKEQYDADFYKEMMRKRTKGQRVGDAAWEAWGVLRAVQSTLDLSFVLLQGGVMTISNMWRRPDVVASAFKNMFASMGSEKKSEEWLRKIKAQPWYSQAKEAKLAITQPHAQLTNREELFMSDWTRIAWSIMGLPLMLKSKAAHDRWVKANPFRALERGASAYLDVLRVERYLEGVKMLEARKADINGKEVTTQDYKDVADVVNTLTGRASLGAMEQFSSGLTKLFYSPRMWASAIKTGTPYGLYHFGRMTPTARKMAILDMGRFFATTMSFVTLAAIALADDDDDETYVETDPRSADFGKIRIGDIRVDPWGGRVQQAVATTRLALGGISLFMDKPIDAYKRGDKTMPLGKGFGTPTMFDVGLTMALNKLSPSASFITEAARTTIGKDGKRYSMYDKDPYVIKDEFNERLMPLYVGTVAELMQDDPGALEGFLAFYSLFGASVNVYGKKPKAKASGTTQGSTRVPKRPE